ncbi:cell division control protein 45 homolog [Lineus longissimus]|uniref:cell division control protein 45 homolog n=1 Tax=Lineus longissimus TaxID=88925 RepID=UPI002B4C3DA9
MVVVKDFRKDFYDPIQTQRVLVLVALDVDALCALKILQYLFQCDHVLYTIMPVSGRQELETAFMENCEGIKCVMMLNCGGNIDIVELLQPDEDVTFFICDSHRPIDVHNIYNVKQVQLILKEELEDVPDFNEIFREENSDDDSGNESDSSERANKRRRFDEESLNRKREKREWWNNRERTLFEYYEFNSHGMSTAVTIFELAWKMSKDTNDLLWLATIGLTDQFVHYKINREKYIESLGSLQSHVSRLNHRGDDEDTKKSISSLKLAFEEELQLNLYRHWTLFDSLCHSVTTACKFRVWTMKGKKKLHEFLADMGLPLVQCQQKYMSMDVSLRTSVKEMISNKAEKYGLSPSEIFIPSFLAQYGYRNKLCAMDVAYACAALLESVEKSKKQSDCFLDALDLLTRDRSTMLEKGLENAKTQLKAVVNQVNSFLDMTQVISAGPFLYAFIGEGTPDVKFFAKPICLQKLAKFTLKAHCAMSKSRKAPTLPLLLGAALDNDRGTTLVVGIPPLAEDDGRNFFGKAFEQAAESTSSRILQDSFDSNIVEMKTEDRSKFFDALINLMQYD